MRQFVPFNDATGKTIERILDEHQAVLVVLFTDGTWSCIGTGQFYDEDPHPTTPQAYNFHGTFFPIATLIEAGVLTQAESDAMDEEHHRKFAEQRERDERSEYERLRKKFEGDK